MSLEPRDTRHHRANADKLKARFSFFMSKLSWKHCGWDFLSWCIFYHHPIKVQHMIPDNIDPPDDAFVICQVTRPLFYFFFLQLWFNWTLLGHVKSSEPFFTLNFVTHTQSKLYRPHSIQIQNGWCLTSLMVSGAPLGITLLLTSLSDELLNPPLSKGPSFLYIKNLKQKGIKSARKEE